MTARARVRAVLVLCSFRAASGLLLAYPVARTLAAFLPQTFPTSDTLLFAPGGMFAVEALRLGKHAIRASLEGSGLSLVLLGITASFPFAIALSSLVHPSETLPSLAKRGAESTPSLVALGGAAALAQGLGIAAIAGVVGWLAGSFDSLMDERRGDLLVVLLGLALTVPLFGLGLLHDLARAAVVRYGMRAIPSAKSGARKLWRAPGPVITAWLSPAAVSVALVLLAAWMTGVLDVGRPSAARVWAVAALHQATIVALVALRLRWLERALSLVDPPERPDATATVSDPPQALLVDRPARSGAPDDPTPDPVA
jgi:hypothetical protein